MQKVPVAVLGASGYSGIEATRILAHHPHAELRVVGSDRWQGDTVEKRLGPAGAAGKLRDALPERAAQLARGRAPAPPRTPLAAALRPAPSPPAPRGKGMGPSGGV